MTGCLLDTNVISELTREFPNPQVTAFLGGRDDVWLSSVLIHEVEYGLRLLPWGRRRSRLSAMQRGILEEYVDRILPLDRTAAEWAAEFRANARRAGKAADMGDTLVAGIAKAHNLVVVTRNVSDFQWLDVEVLDPWSDP